MPDLRFAAARHLGEENLRKVSYMLKSTISIEWIVHAPKGGKVKVIARHERAGVVRTELELK